MPLVKILTDSLADIPPAILKDLDITTIPCIVRIGEKEYRDRVDLSTAQFYQQLTSSAVLPKTSQPAVGVFEQAYRDLAQTTDAIVSIHVVGKLSGVLNTALLAAKNIPNTRIEVIDSHQVSMGQGWPVILAARAAKAGTSLDEIKSILDSAIQRVHLIAALDTLEYARRGGRLGKGAALIGTLLNVKPLIEIIDDEVVPLENVRTQKHALERLVQIALQSGTIQEIAVIHAAAEQSACQVIQMLANSIPQNQILLTETGPVLGAHAGPGAVGIAWLTSDQ
jgi:DegV family protein with EDD domain